MRLQPTEPARPQTASFVRVFNMPDGKAVAIDKRTVAQVRQGDDSVIIAFRFNGQRPLPIVASFSDVYRWWTIPVKESGNET